jgi:hypothetical protein
VQEARGQDGHRNCLHEGHWPWFVTPMPPPGAPANPMSALGVAIAQRLGEEGANVVVSSRRKDHVDKAIKLLQVPLPSAR